MTDMPDHPGAGGFIQTKQALSATEHEDLLLEAHRRLKQKIEQGGNYPPAQKHLENPNTLVPLHRIKPIINRLNELEYILGDKPLGWKKPNYGTLEYYLAFRKGWISKTEEGRDKMLFEQRRQLSLKSCHRYSGKWRRIPANHSIPSSGGYAPEVSASILNDHMLSDGAKIMAIKLLELIYRENRESRALETTVGYLARMLGKHKRTIQNYLTLLEHRGYIAASIVFNKVTKMSVGLLIALQEPLFPNHHKEKWPEKRRKSGVQLNSFKIFHSKNTDIIDRLTWAQRCMDGIFRSFMNNQIPFSQETS